ncbi:MAG: PQQ-binding-like beta-propeller repeat protein, partial [Gemmataceae bacterium]
AYIPFADDETILDELQLALNAVAYDGDKPHPAVVKATTNKVASRRAAAGVALCAGPLTEQMPLIRKLLSDKEPAVRAKVALALAEAKEPEAVPVMIKLIAEAGSELTAPLEDYLVRLSREAGPKDLEGDDKRKERSEAWAKWWEANKDKVAMLDRTAPSAKTTYLGYTLLVKNGNNEISELDKDNKERWKITGLLGPWDAQWLGNNRVLVAEYNANRVTERDVKTGDIKWRQERLPSNVQQAERLKNGNTFIVCRNALIEVDKAGKERFRLNRPAFDVYTARRLPNGQIVLVTTNRQIIRFDKNGKEIKSFSVPEIHYFQNEILDNGHVLVPLGWRNQVVEYNTEGKEVMRLNANQPTHAVRLPNGHTLVLSQNWPNPIIEFDKKNKQISSYNTNSYAFRVKRR